MVIFNRAHWMSLVSEKDYFCQQKQIQPAMRTSSPPPPPPPYPPSLQTPSPVHVCCPPPRVCSCSCSWFCFWSCSFSLPIYLVLLRFLFIPCPRLPTAFLFFLLLLLLFRVFLLIICLVFSNLFGGRKQKMRLATPFWFCCMLVLLLLLLLATHPISVLRARHCHRMKTKNKRMNPILQENPQNVWKLCGQMFHVTPLIKMLSSGDSVGSTKHVLEPEWCLAVVYFLEVQKSVRKLGQARLGQTH